jgi:RecB family exonuclease
MRHARAVQVVSRDGGSGYSWAHIKMFKSPRREIYRAVMRFSPGGQVERRAVEKLDQERSGLSPLTERPALASLRCGYQKFR